MRSGARLDAEDPRAVVKARRSQRVSKFADCELGCRRSRGGSGGAPPVEIVVTTLTIELPDDLAQEARERGLLDSAAIGAMIRAALRRRTAQELLESAAELAAAQIPPMTMTEIQKEVDAVRAERRRRASDA